MRQEESMSTLTIELPEALSKQIQKKISQQQLETAFFRVLQLCLSETPPIKTDTEMMPSHPQQHCEICAESFRSQVPRIFMPFASK